MASKPSLNKSALKSCAPSVAQEMLLVCRMRAWRRLPHPSIQPAIARFRKPEQLLRMLLIQNVLAATVSRAESTQRSKTLARVC